MTETATEAVRICASEELVDGGAGVRRAARLGGGDVVVF
ncbi:MAG: Rieske (2Fe-2S) protein, partial [Paraburkholderia nemoris]